MEDKRMKFKIVITGVSGEIYQCIKEGGNGEVTDYVGTVISAGGVFLGTKQSAYDSWDEDEVWTILSKNIESVRVEKYEND